MILQCKQLCLLYGHKQTMHKAREVRPALCFHYRFNDAYTPSPLLICGQQKKACNVRGLISCYTQQLLGKCYSPFIFFNLTCLSCINTIQEVFESLHPAAADWFTSQKCSRASNWSHVGFLTAKLGCCCFHPHTHYDLQFNLPVISSWEPTLCRLSASDDGWL